MKKLILAAVMAMATLVSVNAFADADDDSNNLKVAIGCKTYGDVQAGKKVCGDNESSVGTLACRNAFTSEGEKMLLQHYGSFSQKTSPLFASVNSSWSHVLSSWYFDLLPTLSQEDADILYYLFLTDVLYSYVRGIYADAGLNVQAPMMALDNFYKPGGIQMPPRVKKFYQAYFAGDATAIKKMIKTEKPQWNITRVAINTAYCK